MIYNHPGQRIRDFEWASEPGPMPYEEKVHALEVALDASVKDTAWRATKPHGRVHLHLSGGVDSTLLLYKFVASGFPVVAHTMVSHDDHPDLVHAREAVQGLSGDIRHQVHIVQPTDADLESSNRLTGTDSDRPDNYYLLLREVAQHTNQAVGGDVIDELLGGYYAHREGPEAFPRFLGELESNHLDPLKTCSNAFGVTMYLPYSSVAVMQACSSFHHSELVFGNERKRPLYEVARRAGVPESILTRRKMGLVSAVTPPTTV